MIGSNVVPSQGGMGGGAMTREMQDIRINEILVTTTYNRVDRHGYEPAVVILAEFNAVWHEREPTARLATAEDVLRAQEIVARNRAEAHEWAVAHGVAE